MTASSFAALVSCFLMAAGLLALLLGWAVVEVLVVEVAALVCALLALVAATTAQRRLR